jgi:hypothetical protein
MKALDTFLFAATLVIVPALAWLVGRFMGRRDFSIVSVIVAGVAVALMPHLARLAILADMDARPFEEAAVFQLGRTLQNSEVGLFFVAFAIFMTMIGWTSTPVLVQKT